MRIDNAKELARGKKYLGILEEKILAGNNLPSLAEHVATLRTDIENYQYRQVQKLMRDNFVGPAFYSKLCRCEVPKAKLPEGILEVLTSRCPLYDDGKLVKDTHKLTFIPTAVGGMKFSLKKVLALRKECEVGLEIFRHELEQAEKSEFPKVYPKFAKSTIANLALFDDLRENDGRYVLWCDRAPLQSIAYRQGWESSLEQFKADFGATHRPAFGLELVTALEFHTQATGNRSYLGQMGWCLDNVEDRSLFQMVNAALVVGQYPDTGPFLGFVSVDSVHPDLGVSAVWNFQGSWNTGTGYFSYTQQWDFQQHAKFVGELSSSGIPRLGH